MSKCIIALFVSLCTLLGGEGALELDLVLRDETNPLMREGEEYTGNGENDRHWVSGTGRATYVAATVVGFFETQKHILFVACCLLLVCL